MSSDLGQIIKEWTLVAHELNHVSDLARARQIRDELVGQAGCVTADTIRAKFEEERPGAWGPWAGALFRHPDWEPCGWVASEYASNHGAVIRVWRRKETA